MPIRLNLMLRAAVMFCLTLTPPVLGTDDLAEPVYLSQLRQSIPRLRRHQHQHRRRLGQRVPGLWHRGPSDRTRRPSGVRATLFHHVP